MKKNTTQSTVGSRAKELKVNRSFPSVEKQRIETMSAAKKTMAKLSRGMRGYKK